MSDTIPLQFAQSLLRLTELPEEELQADLRELKLPLVLLKDKALPDARISVDDYGRLFIHLVKKLQLNLHQRSEDLNGALEFSAYRMLYLAMSHSSTLRQPPVLDREARVRGESASELVAAPARLEGRAAHAR